MITIDFETHKIDGALPPEPIGVSIKINDEPSVYYAWSHPSGNNCTYEEVKNKLSIAVKQPCLFHNAAFDLSVLRYWFNLPYPVAIHDTLLLLFLEDPHADTLALKPNAEKYLQLPPTERDLLYEWIMQNVHGAKASKAGEHISKAPASLVGPYAAADTDMTYQLFKLLHPRHAGKAYDRERLLVPILTENTLEGVALNVSLLEADFVKYTKVRELANQQIYKRLGMSFNIDSPDELVAAIVKSGLPAEWVYTPTGKRSTAKKNLEAAIKDKELIQLLGYRGTLSTYLDSFFTTWLDKHVNGTLHFSWNQTRNSERGKSNAGTRTGRLSSVPSMLNVPKTPSKFDLDLPVLPKMRSYLMADVGDYWLKRDYSSQELRVLAHYDDGLLMAAYVAKPDLDMHQFVADEVSKILGRPFARRPAKTVAFSLLYGQGLDALSEALSCSRDEALAIKAAYLRAVPGIRSIQDSIKSSTDRNLPITTFGGRKYYKEPGRLIKDKRTGSQRYADFGYKMLNYLIQGSSADITKQAIINYNAIKKDGRFLIAVHDELNVSGPRSEMALLNEAMLDIPLDVQLLSEGYVGPSYGALVDFKE